MVKKICISLIIMTTASLIHAGQFAETILGSINSFYSIDPQALDHLIQNALDCSARSANRQLMYAFAAGAHQRCGKQSVINALGSLSSSDKHKIFTKILRYIPLYSTKKKDKILQFLYGEYGLIADAGQSEAAITCATDKKPIVATFGCGPCVAVGGYDAVNKVAFVVHFAQQAEIFKAGYKIAQHIQALMKKPITTTTPIAIHLRGGIKGFSEDTIDAIYAWIKSAAAIGLPMKIVSQNILRDQTYVLDGGLSLSINANTGKVSDYHHSLNPKGRSFTDLVSTVIASLRNPDIRIAYTAQPH